MDIINALKTTIIENEGVEKFDFLHINVDAFIELARLHFEDGLPVEELLTRLADLPAGVEMLYIAIRMFDAGRQFEKNRSGP